jgi:hypothetical protein
MIEELKNSNKQTNQKIADLKAQIREQEKHQRDLMDMAPSSKENVNSFKIDRRNYTTQENKNRGKSYSYNNYHNVSPRVVRCFACNEVGHKSFECPKQKSQPLN